MRVMIGMFLFLSLFLSMSGQNNLDHFLIVGTYTSGKSEGIYVYRFDTTTAETRQVSVTKKIENPSFLSVDSEGDFIYAVSEKNTGTNPGGEIVAYQFINPSGLMIEKKRISSMGNDPCYIALHPDKKWFAAGNYSSGSIITGTTLSSPSDFNVNQVITHTGSGINVARQESAHVHATVFSPDGKYLLVPDLGIDKVNVYAFDAQTSNIIYNKKKSASSVPGSGPRHLEFHPNGKWVYLMEELSSTVVFFRFNEGKLSKKQRIDAQPAGYQGTRSSADIHVSPDSRYLYCSNRGEANSISVFSISKTGQLALVENQSTQGITPRNFSICPGGKYLLAANQDSDNIAIFAIDQETGKLNFTGKSINVSKPVCLKWIKAKL
jgi:6-phosphogluconolactonase